MNKTISYMSNSLMDQRNNTSKSYMPKKGPVDSNHSIDFNYLAEKLKKLQQENEQFDNISNDNVFMYTTQPGEPTPSTHSPSKTIKYKNPVLNTMGNKVERDRLRPPQKKSLPRSLSNLDKHHTKPSHSFDTFASRRSAERSQSQLMSHMTRQNDKKNYQIQEEPSEKKSSEPTLSKSIVPRKSTSELSKSMRCPNSHSSRPSNLLRKSLNVNSSMKQTAKSMRKLSESLRSDTSPSLSETSRSDNMSFQSESMASLSCTSRSSSSSPKNRRKKPNDSSKQKQVKRGVSSLGVATENKPKIIVIRREKSIACQSTSTGNDQTQTLDDRSLQKSKTSKTHKTKSVNEEHLIMKHNLMASLTMHASTNLDANNSGHSGHNAYVMSNSSTTSGVELSSKNSTNGVNSAHGDDSTENIHKNDQDSGNDCENRQPTIKELKNRIFVMELQLDSHAQKLAKEKELKRKLVTELKNRYETEKYAALKALDAKLNAEKLFELNKLKEQIEVEKHDESDLHQRSFDSELLSIKLKLREKVEKCSKLEKMLKEEQNKNTQLFAKSMEIVKKYNQEVKNFKGAHHTPTSQVSTAVQTDGTDVYKEELERSQAIIKEQILNVKAILEAESADGKHTIQHTSLSKETDFQSIIYRVETLAKTLRTNLDTSQSELRNMHKHNEKLSDDFKACKETKQKLESLYKIKCKSDLNKSAQIKKCQLNYELELMKFRNEYNCDLVRHLQEQLTAKESQLFAQNSHLENVSDLIENLNDPTLSSECLNSLEKIKEMVRGVHKNSTNNLRDSRTCANNLATRIVSKEFVPNVLFNRINDDDDECGASIGRGDDIEKVYHEKNVQLQEQIHKLDEQLNEMRLSNKRLTNEKEELMSQMNESTNKSSNMNVTVIDASSKKSNTDLMSNMQNSTFNSRIYQTNNPSFEKRLNTSIIRKPSSTTRENVAKQGTVYISNNFSRSQNSPVLSLNKSQLSDKSLFKEKQNRSAPI